MSQQRNPGEGLIKCASEIFTEDVEEAPYASFSVGLGPGGPPPVAAVPAEEEP